jgi:hypothetical protein
LRIKVNNTPGKGPRSAPRRNKRSATAAEARETRTDREEFARRHIIHQDKLEWSLFEAEKALRDWKFTSPDGQYLKQPQFGRERTRKARNPEEREELKALEAAVVAAKAKLLLHENDGRLL